MMDLQPNWTDSGTPEELTKRYELPRIEPGWIEEPASTMLLIRVVERRGKEYYRLHCWNRAGVRAEFAAIGNMKVLGRSDDDDHN